jgi:hypothetical protein
MTFRKVPQRQFCPLSVLIVRSLVITGSGANCRGGKTVSAIESKVCTSTVKVVPLHPVKEAPFPEMKGECYYIFLPTTTTATNQVNLLGTPETWIEQLTRRYKWLNERTMGYVGTPEERSVSTYLEMELPEFEHNCVHQDARFRQLGNLREIV